MPSDDPDSKWIQGGCQGAEALFAGTEGSRCGHRDLSLRAQRPLLVGTETSHRAHREL